LGWTDSSDSLHWRRGRQEDGGSHQAEHPVKTAFDHDIDEFSPDAEKSALVELKW
jgi:hypothetical protein